MSRPRSSKGTAVAALPLLLLLALPLVALLMSARPSDLGAALAHPSFAAALGLSLRSSLLSLALMVGTGLPLAWWLAHHEGRTQRVLSTLVELPVVLPPAVVGLGLLLALGHSSPLGRGLEAMGMSPLFGFAAVVLAQIVVASPFFVQAATSAFREIEPEHLLVAETLGATARQAFWRVAMPASLPALVGGAALAWARAMGEFGATLLFAGNLEGVTQTMPLAIYTALDGELPVALALALVLATVGTAILLTVRWISARSPMGGAAS